MNKKKYLNKIIYILLFLIITLLFFYLRYISENRINTVYEYKINLSHYITELQVKKFKDEISQDEITLLRVLSEEDWKLDRIIYSKRFFLKIRLFFYFDTIKNQDYYAQVMNYDNETFDY